MNADGFPVNCSDWPAVL